MLVKESIGFERYKDPKRALGLVSVYAFFDVEIKTAGSKKFYHFTEKIDSAIDKNNLYTYIFALGSGNVYLKKESWQNKEIRGYAANLEEAEEFIYQQYLKLRSRNLKESISFERYRDPKTALGLNPIEYYFNIERPSADIYRFVEKRPTEWSTKLKYTYSIDKGNIYLKKPQAWSTQELRSNSSAFNKGNPKKMAIPNDLKGAEEFILNHYLKLLKKQGIKESVSFERYRDPKTALGLKPHFIYNIKYDPETEGFSYEQDNIAIGKYIKTLIPEINDNEINRFISFTIDGYINDIIPTELFEKNDEELIEKLLKQNIARESMYWMKINSDEVMRGLARNSGLNI